VLGLGFILPLKAPMSTIAPLSLEEYELAAAEGNSRDVGWSTFGERFGK
jgi:hypothetical protein